MRALLNPFVFAAGGGGGPTPTIVQHKYADGRNEDPTIIFAGAPTVGNLIVACYMDGAALTNFNSAYWTQGPQDAAAPNCHAIWCYRYVQSGDVAAQGEFCNPEQSAYTAAVAWEIAGANAAWASALEHASFDYVDSSPASTETSTSFNTTNDNVLALAAYGGNWIFGSAPLATGAWTQDESAAGFSFFAGGAHQEIVDSGDPVQITVNFQGNGWSHEIISILGLKA